MFLQISNAPINLICLSTLSFINVL
jgi:hypothetical protein